MEKAFLRKIFLAKRMEMPQEQKDLKNKLIAEKTIQFVMSRSLSKVHVFLPHPLKNEVDCWPIVSGLWESDISTIAPYVVPGTCDMNHYLLNEKTELVPNQWKIPEPNPATSQLVQPKEIDAVLVPLLAFDNNGYRVGYGGGYYDRFLIQCRENVLKIGLSHFGHVEEISDINLHDIPLDICITPDHIYRFT